MTDTHHQVWFQNRTIDDDRTPLGGASDKISPNEDHEDHFRPSRPLPRKSHPILTSPKFGFAIKILML
jgi:hypothetical protein